MGCVLESSIGLISRFFARFHKYGRISHLSLKLLLPDSWSPYCNHLEHLNHLAIRKSRVPEPRTQIPKIKVSVKGMTPYVIYGQNGELSGVDFDILQALSEKLRFHYEFIRENAWMTKNESGNVNGGIIHTVSDARLSKIEVE